MTVPDVVQKRNEWVRMISETDPNKLVFLDESGVNTDMTRHYGRAVGKERAVDNAPENTPTNTTILSSIRLNGKTAYTTYSGGTTGDRFVEYLEKVLIPTLHEGDIVIMDNMRSHHVNKVSEVLQKAKIQLLYLPPYSPDLNPIEKMWSKMKAIMRKMKIRDCTLLPDAVKRALGYVRISDCKGWFRSCAVCC